MTPALRNAHRYIWLSLAVLLPIGWLAAIWVIPGEIWQDPVRPGEPAPLPVLAASAQSGELRLNLRQDSSGRRRQLECSVFQPLSEPNMTLVLEGAPEVVLCTPNTRGTLRIDLDSLPAAAGDTLRIRLEDRIAGRRLRSMVLAPPPH